MTLFAALVRPVESLPVLQLGVGPAAICVGGLLIAWGLAAHSRAGQPWWSWDAEDDSEGGRGE